MCIRDRSLVYYLSREQYGEAPLIYGPHYMANMKEDPDNPGHVAIKEGEMRYVKGKTRYVPIGKQRSPEYQDEDMQLFPRVWDPSTEQGHQQFYADWLNLVPVSYTHLRAHETGRNLVCRLLLEKKK